MTAIFDILCGILYLIGLCFGCSYQEISVIICIYIWPVLCDIAALVGVFIWGNRNFILRTLTCCNISLFVLFIFTTQMFWQHYDTADAFNLCVNDLNQIAARTGMTYAEVNIYVYVYLFASIMVFYSLQFIMSRCLARKGKRATTK